MPGFAETEVSLVLDCDVLPFLMDPEALRTIIPESLPEHNSGFVQDEADPVFPWPDGRGMVLGDDLVVLIEQPPSKALGPSLPGFLFNPDTTFLVDAEPEVPGSTVFKLSLELDSDPLPILMDPAALGTITPESLLELDPGFLQDEVEPETPVPDDP